MHIFFLSFPQNFKLLFYNICKHVSHYGKSPLGGDLGARSMSRNRLSFDMALSSDIDSADAISFQDHGDIDGVEAVSN